MHASMYAYMYVCMYICVYVLLLVLLVLLLLVNAVRQNSCTNIHTSASSPVSQDLQAQSAK